MVFIAAICSSSSNQLSTNWGSFTNSHARHLTQHVCCAASSVVSWLPQLLQYVANAVALIVFAGGSAVVVSPCMSCDCSACGATCSAGVVARSAAAGADAVSGVLLRLPSDRPGRSTSVAVRLVPGADSRDGRRPFHSCGLNVVTRRSTVCGSWLCSSGSCCHSTRSSSWRGIVLTEVIAQVTWSV